MPDVNDSNLSPVNEACHAATLRQTHAFTGGHELIRIFSGTLQFSTAGHTLSFQSGDTLLVQRNQLAKLTAIPPQDGDFRSISVTFSKAMLQAYAQEHRISTAAPYTGEKVLRLQPNPLYESYTSSLAIYHQGATNQLLTDYKVKEALLIILHLDPHSTSLLFDLQEPEKKELPEFMEQHFRLNVGMADFAYLTGRSLATFKRDFTKIFQTSPGRWLQTRRLKEARYLIREKRMKVSAVYTEVGFEDLSHFSFAFKNEFGKAPTLI